MIPKPPKVPTRVGKPNDRLHVAFGSKLVISAEGRLGIAALLVLVVGLALALGGLQWTFPW